MQPGDVRDLETMIENGARLEMDHAVYIIIGCCKALARAGHRGVITPGRIQISGRGDVTIGEAVLRPHSFGYASPELVSDVREPRREPLRIAPDGSAHGTAHAAPRTTAEIELGAVFALGAILWELLAGRPLFRGETGQGTEQLVAVAHVPPLLDIPQQLDAITRKALAKNVEHRYRTARELGDALADDLVIRARS